MKERWEGVGEVREERVAPSGGERHSRNELKEVPRCPGNSSFSRHRLGGEKVKQQSVIEKVNWPSGCEKQRAAKQGLVSLSASHSRHRPRAGRMRKD